MTDTVLIDVPMPIVTPRLLLRPPQEGDGAAVHEAKRESWEHLSKWSIWTFKPLDETTVDDDEAFCRHKQAMFAKREDIPLLSFDRHSGRFIGGAGLHKCNWKNRIFSLGFWVRTSEMHKGYATEAATALARYAFGELGAAKVSSFHAEGNNGSRRVLEKIGFEREGILRRQHDLSGGLVDEYVYGLLGCENVPELDVRWGS